MIFQERRVGETYSYTVEDVFGTITIASTGGKLEKDTLDSIVSGVLQSGASEGTIGETVTFAFEKAPAWLPEEDSRVETRGEERRRCKTPSVDAVMVLCVLTLVLMAIVALFV